MSESRKARYTAIGKRVKAERDAVTRLRAAMLDLTTAQRFTEANDVLAIIERIEPPGARPGEGAARVAARPRVGDGIPLPSSAPATLTFYDTDDTSRDPNTCGSCDRTLAQHCTTHLLPCCPGSLMHGQDEGTWTPAPIEWDDRPDKLTDR